MKIGFIGAGNMGAAIIAGIYKVHKIWICETDKKRATALKRKYKVSTCSIECMTKTCDVIVLAVKPQGMEEVVKELAQFINKNTLVVSIAAGITTKFLEKLLPTKTRVVRTMPNMPAQIGQGMTAISKGKNATAKDVKIARKIFDCVGETIIIEEKMMDAFTAVSGSGPAYVFYVAECMTAGAKALGFSEQEAVSIVTSSSGGSMIQLVRSIKGKKDSAEGLRKKVTSKGGTTEAALKVFTKAKTDKIFKDAMKAARNRGRELSK